MSTKFIDFTSVKEQINIAGAAERLGLQLKRSANQLRGFCLRCKSGGDRALVITPDKGSFYCWAEKTGGDVIALVAHIKDIGMRDAAEYLVGRPQEANDNVPAAKPKETQKGIKPLDYLDHEHESIKALGIDPLYAKEYGIGYASKGTMRGRVLLPVSNRTCILLGYCGVAADQKAQPRFLLPQNLDPATVIFGEDRVEEGEVRIASNPLEAVLASQNGSQAVAFLTETIGSIQLEMLASLLDEHKAELVI